MAKGFKKGTGGLPLNFRVVGGTVQPENPRKNTFWVHTDVPISQWIFSASDPYLIEEDIFERGTVTEGYYIDANGGQVSGSGYKFVNVEIPAGTTHISITGAGSATTKVCHGFYGADGTLISTVLRTIGTVKHAVPAGAARIKVSFYGEDVNAITVFRYEDIVGSVWLYTSTSSPVVFNALKKNGLQVYPNSAMQFVDGAMVRKPVKCFQGGKWTDLWNGVLYDAGEEYIPITGGWKGANRSTGSTATGSITKAEDHIETSNVVNGTYGATFENAVDMSLFTTLHMTVSATKSGTAEFSIADKFPAASVDNSLEKTVGTAETTIDFPIDTVTGYKCVHIRWKDTASKLKIHKVWME